MSRAGIKQIAMCDLGTLATTPAGIVKLGLRDKASMEIVPHKTLRDYKNRELPNMQNIKVEAKSYQPTMYMLNKLIGFLNNNVDTQIISVPQSATAGSEDVHKFVSSNTLGLDFELLISDTERSMKVTLERAFRDADFATLISTIETDSAVTLGADAVDGVDFTLYRKPYTVDFKSPDDASSNLCTDADIMTKEFSIKTKGKKSIINTSIVEMLSVRFAITFRDASFTKYAAIRALGNAPELLFKESNGSTYYDKFLFPAGALSLSPSFKNDDEDRSLTLVYEGDVALYDCAVSVGATNVGDSAGGTGLNGGTFTVS